MRYRGPGRLEVSALQRQEQAQQALAGALSAPTSWFGPVDAREEEVAVQALQLVPGPGC